MHTNNLNSTSYKKMTAEQDKYRDWLKKQSDEQPKMPTVCADSILIFRYSNSTKIYLRTGKTR
jgi:hypothetical protein